MSESNAPFLAVEEFHGPYGPYHVSELVLQKIWLEQAFDASRLLDSLGRRVEVLCPGAWNRLEGPDFRQARLRIGGEIVEGDVEVHFSVEDWERHAHGTDPRYDGVILQVLYYSLEVSGGRDARSRSGKAIPSVALLPLLWHSLEEYAGEDSLVSSTGVALRPEVDGLLQLPQEERRLLLIQRAKERWTMKRHFAELRQNALGWEKACHQSALECLGYSRNRVPMLMVADQFSLSDFAAEGLELDRALQAGGERWRLNGCRPANLPRRRLQQYANWVRARPDWPRQIESWGKRALGKASLVEEWGSLARRGELGLPGLRSALLETELAGCIGGARGDTLVCDILLPLIAARIGHDGFELWFHWNAGDAPANCFEALRTAQVVEPRRIPMSNGWVQGMIASRVAETASLGGG